MPDILVLHASPRGTSQAIAGRIADRLVEHGASAVVRDLTAPGTAVPLDDFDAVILGGSVDMGRHPSELEAFIRARASELADKTTGLFSVSLSAAPSQGEAGLADAQGYVDDLLSRATWQPEAVLLVAGGLALRRYGPFSRGWARLMAFVEDLPVEEGRDPVSTAWGQVEVFAHLFAWSVAADPARWPGRVPPAPKLGPLEEAETIFKAAQAHQSEEEAR